MIRCKFTKSVMENEEGMNHLWIRTVPPDGVERVGIRVVVPAGFVLSPNLNGYPETEDGEIMIADRCAVHDVVMELCTRKPVKEGEYAVVASVTYYGKEGEFSRMEQLVTLKLLPEEEIDDYGIDEEVLQQIKQLQERHAAKLKHKEPLVLLPAPFLTIDPNRLSELEKKYRVDYSQASAIVRAK